MKSKHCGGRALCVLAALLVGAAEVPVFAQQWPANPLRIIVPFPAGQAADLIARIIADRLGPVLGQHVVVDNRPGAGGLIGAELTAKGSEQGVKGYDVIAWGGLVAPAGTPPSVLERLNREIVKIVNTPEVQQRFSEMAIIPVGNTREQFAAFLKAELPQWARAVKVSGAKVE